MYIIEKKSDFNGLPADALLIFYDNDSWAVRLRGNCLISHKCSTIKEAVRVARELAESYNAGIFIMDQ